MSFLSTHVEQGPLGVWDLDYLPAPVAKSLLHMPFFSSSLCRKF